jgi:hypothetical protein
MGEIVGGAVKYYIRFRVEGPEIAHEGETSIFSDPVKENRQSDRRIF